MCTLGPPHIPGHCPLTSDDAMTRMLDEAISTPQAPKPGRTCPDCVFGRLPNGSFSIGPGGIGSELGSKCPTCDGVGRVILSPAPR
jgi:hypothetical protein